jgi:cAMP-dependent protein kinase regulator
VSSVAHRIKQLRSEALALAQNGELRRALEKLAALEALDESEPDWPRRAAECHRLLGERAQQLDALSRAAKGYVGAGMVVKAMAICRMMLAIEPSHPTALDWMRTLEPPLGVQRIALPPAATPQHSPLDKRPRLAGATETKASASNDAQPVGESKSLEATEAQRLVAERGLVAVARLVARKTGRNPPVDPEVRLVEASVPAAPSDSTGPPSGNWQVVDDAELVEDDADDSSTARPAVLSLPPLSVDGELRSIVPGSEIVVSHDKHSGMFRLAIDEALPTPQDDALRQARQLLPAVPLFSEVDPATLEGLTRHSRLLHLESGEIVIRQDDLPDCLYVVVSGGLVVVDENASEGELYRLAENEFCGESALISNEPSPATVRAVEASDLLAFDREAMRACIATNPAVVPVLLRFLRSRMVEHLVRTSPLFTHFATAERRALTRKFEFIEVAENALLVEQGSRSPGLFVLLSGAVDVTLGEDDQEQWLATLERGGVFGEMSLLRGSKASANVRCVSPGFALMLPAKEFREVIMTHPPFLEVLTLMSEERGQSNRRRAGHH